MMSGRGALWWSPFRLSNRASVLMGDGNLAYRSDGRSGTPKSGQEKALKGAPIVGFDTKKEDVFRVRPISTDYFHPFGFRIKQRVGTPFVHGAGFGRMALC